MITSAELRWFYPGTLPEEISNWFEQCCSGTLKPPEEREDLYLYSPSDNLGIKLRQGRLEVKWRKAFLGILRFGDCSGKAEKWGKWMCEDPTLESFQKADAKGKWVSVHKMRSQRLLENGAIELTQLNINHNNWWSLAFEVYGEDRNLIDNLQTVASSVFQSYQGQKLQQSESYAYPDWLCQVVE